MSRTGSPQREFSKGQWFTHPRGEHLKHTGAHVQREVLWNRMGLEGEGDRKGWGVRNHPGKKPANKRKRERLLNGFVSLSRLGRVISVSLSLVLIGRCLLSLSSLLLSSLPFSLFFSSILLSSLLPCRLIWWPHPCLTALSLPSLLFSPPLSLFGWFGGLIPASLALSLVLVGWLFPSLVWAGWLLFLSLVLAGLHFLSLSLSLSSLFGFGWVASPFTCVCSVVSPIPSSLVCWLGGVCSPLSVYTLSSVAWVASCPSVSLSLSFSRSYWWAGVFPSCGGWVASPPPLLCRWAASALSLSPLALSLSLSLSSFVLMSSSLSPALPLSLSLVLVGWFLPSPVLARWLLFLALVLVAWRFLYLPLLSPSSFGWRASSLSCFFWMSSLSLSLSLPLLFSVSLSLYFIGWMAPSFTCVGWLVSVILSISPSLMLAGWRLLPLSLSSLFCCGGGVLPLPLSLSLGWRFPLLRWLGGFSPSVSLVSLGGVCAPSPSLTVYYLLSLSSLFCWLGGFFPLPPSLSLVFVGWLLPSLVLARWLPLFLSLSLPLSCVGWVASALALSLSGSPFRFSLSLSSAGWRVSSPLPLSPALSPSLSLSLVLVGRPHLQSK